MQATEAASAFPAPPLNGSDFNLTCPPTSDYPLTLQLGRLTVLTGGVVAASAMSVCATTVSLLGGALITDRLGHSARAGLGHGRAAGAGAASGAGHGGYGGDSAAVANSTAVEGGAAYGVDHAPPGTLGSGGGGDGGGPGGGVIHLIASDSLTFATSGKLSANGGAGLDGTTGGVGGSGGGSGGSIAVRAGTVFAPQGTGVVEANGGIGGWPGGGGGAGGRVWLGPADGTWSLPPPVTIEKFFYTPRGGDGASGAHGGGSGTLGGTICGPGHGGLLCQPCVNGSAKAGWGDGPCSVCAPGTVARVNGSATCEACPPGLVASVRDGPQPPLPGVGGTVCLPCPAGQRADSGGARCDTCAAPPLHANFTGPNTCDWRCIPPFVLFGAARAAPGGGGGCGLFFEVLFESIGLAMHAPAAGHALLLLPAVAAVGLLAALYTLPSSMRRRVIEGMAAAEAAREGGLPEAQTLRGSTAASVGPLSSVGAEACAGPEASSAPASSVGPLSWAGSVCPKEPLWRRLHHFGGTSLSSALTWEAHKYRAKQHVLRVYLTGANSPFAPWAMPVLPHELKALVSETSYYAFCETFREASRSGKKGGQSVERSRAVVGRR
jgi:hypothetical protein